MSGPTTLRFTKMHGAGNDFVVLDATRAPLALTPAQARRLADRHFGVGCDQILIVEPPPSAEVDFAYRILNAGGDEVEHCGNGARCFLRYVRERGLTSRDVVRVQTVNNRIELRMAPDGGVTVDMNRPRFEPVALPFDPSGLQPRHQGALALWPLDGLDGPEDGAHNAPAAFESHEPNAGAGHAGGRGSKAVIEVGLVSMGNPHAVWRVADADAAPVATLGPRIEHHRRFAQRVNVGFMQVLAPDRVRLRVWERGAGETLACGTGACAAVAAGIRAGWLARRVAVALRGGTLHIDWPDDAATLRMTGPAEFVFEGEITL
jgi:diaminopimelate epimerase